MSRIDLVIQDEVCQCLQKFPLGVKEELYVPGIQPPYFAHKQAQERLRSLAEGPQRSEKSICCHASR